MSKITHANLSAVKASFDEAKTKSKRSSRHLNIDLLWTALESIRNSGLSNYSLAEVGRRTEALGGMKTQSLRNAPSQEFRDLIDQYADAAKPDIPNMEASQIDKAISMISDAGLRVALKTQQAEMRRIKHENDQLRAAFKSLSLNEKPKNTGLNAALPEPLAKHLKAALAKGLNPSRMNERGLSIAPNGAIVDESGTQFFPPGFATAIQHILHPQVIDTYSSTSS